ncbi:hypothetical protein [Tenacibaculum sp. 190130A14a]|uniref:Uncharacterized protein n=1 Tax=Tenacibaculum polynesiense TaxID=3137857 RepID=A0ABP1F895_9FLAO
MVATENLTLTMEYFSNLNDAERTLFLSVVTPKTQNTKKHAKKRKKKELPSEFREDSFYKDLVENHNKKVKNRLEKIKGQEINSTKG